MPRRSAGRGRRRLVFVTAGLGGGTGSGAAPIVAAKARERVRLTIAVVTKPFDFEGVQRLEIADAAAATLLSEVDALITVANDRVGEVVEEDTIAARGVPGRRRVLLQAVQGIVDLLTAPGLINLDFADVRADHAERRTGAHRARSRARPGPGGRSRPRGHLSPLLDGRHPGRSWDPVQRLRPADLAAA